MSRPLRIFTWHVHGSYLYALSHIRHEIYVPVKPGLPAGYTGRGRSFPWPGNIHEVPVEEVRRQQFDCVLFQSREHYIKDQYKILSPAQQRLPSIYLEHDPPREHPTDTRHIVDDPNMLLVHVTPFNHLMWDSGRTPTCVIEHGIVIPPSVHYRGELERGIAVVNNLLTRGRRLGADIFARVRNEAPVDLIGMGAQTMGGLGEVPPLHVPDFIAHYRFFFNPIRYTSLGMAVCEAMMVGMPIIGLATTEMVTTIENGVSGYLDTDVRRLISYMQDLLKDPSEARRLGENARRYARERFQIQRFVRDWETALAFVTDSVVHSGSRVFHTALPREEFSHILVAGAGNQAQRQPGFLRHVNAVRNGSVIAPYGQ
jgi:hypothetical protein